MNPFVLQYRNAVGGNKRIGFPRLRNTCFCCISLLSEKCFAHSFYFACGGIVFMKKNAAAIVSSLLVLSCAFPVFAAAKHVYTDRDSGFSVTTANPMMEYASKYSYGFQENSSTTDSLTSIAAIPADVVEKKTGQPFTTKEFMTKLTLEMNKKSQGKSDYVLFQPETYAYTTLLSSKMEDSLFQVFDQEDLKDAKLSYGTKTVGNRNYYVISMQHPGALKEDKTVEKNATDVEVYLTSDNNILYLAESYCSAEPFVKEKKAADKDSTIKKEYETKGVSMDTAETAMQNPRSLHKAILPLTDSSLSDTKFQKNLKKERDTILKSLTFFKPEKNVNPFGMEDPVIKQFVTLPDQWIYAKCAPEIKDQDGLRLNLAWAAPYTMVANMLTQSSLKDAITDFKPEDFYSLYDESVLFASYSFRKKNKNVTNFADEIFSIPQSEMQKALEQMLPELTKNEKIKEYAVFSNPKARITNDGNQIKLHFDSNIKVINKFDFLAHSLLTGTRDKGVFSLYVSKGDHMKTKAAANLADTLKLLPE